jgi:two-component system, NtrC family, sensor histidine kinase HydH
MAIGSSDSIGGLRDWMSLLAAVGNLSLAVITVFAGRRSPLAWRLALLCFVLFGWNFSVLAHHVLQASGGAAVDAFTILDAFFTALSPPLVLEVVLSFVGETRRHRSVRLAAWVLFAGLAVASLGAFSSPAVLRWNDSASWSIMFLAGYVPSLAFEVAVLARYLRRAISGREKSRARIVLAAVAIGGAFSMSDVARGAGLPTPYLGAAGTLIAAALLTTLVVRLALFERGVPVQTTVYVLGMIVAFAIAYLVVLSAFAGRLVPQVFGASLITLLVAAVVRELALSFAEARARTQRLAVLGRFSAQMAHDIKTPLTALLGALAVIEDAGDEGTKKEFLGLVSDQAKRIGAVVDRYDRMARIEPRKTLVRLDEIVRSLARAHGLRADPLHLRLASGDAECDGDPALLESAVENVVRNAIEATNAPDLVEIETRVDADFVVVCVVDRGPGMEARVATRALEDFFTTKPDGSGLGLAFVRRVIEAHDGTLTLTSRPVPHPDHGTTVELRIPAALGPRSR